MKKIILLLAFLITSCSLTGRNLVQENEFELAGGSKGEKVWKDELKMKRISWYQEMTMVFDVLMGEVTESSPFYNWFSTSEKVSLKRCEKSYLAIYYSSASEVISKKSFLKQAKAQGYDQFILNDFTSALKLHPQYIANSFQLYDVAILCSTSSLNSPLKVEFPNFSTISF
ncbi:hypothetical protein BIY24_13020 [Halobacteriovorax marinus]|uniref:hypothetical protein n=1 Tax=Halobacteriovorax marinus TaxID=97084 RepID=UPI000BC30C51|nr:hypothetical protein [Halobacteriovorax marinus]ATH08834.1 hypothetical protein BIY24_13020 [Halobacteriovorax marinus]